MSGLEESTRNEVLREAVPRRLVAPGVRSGRTTPSSRRTRIPVVLPLEARRNRIVSTWSEAVWPVARRRPGEGVTKVAELGFGARALGRLEDLGTEALAQKRASSSDSSPRSLWLTWSAERGSRGPRAHARGRSSPGRPRRGRVTSPPGGIRSCRRTCSSMRARRAAASTHLIVLRLSGREAAKAEDREEDKKEEQPRCSL